MGDFAEGIKWFDAVDLDEGAKWFFNNQYAAKGIGTGVKPVIQPTRAKNIVVPFKEKSSFHFVVLWQILNGME